MNKPRKNILEKIKKITKGVSKLFCFSKLL